MTVAVCPAHRIGIKAPMAGSGAEPRRSHLLIATAALFSFSFFFNRTPAP